MKNRPIFTICLVATILFTLTVAQPAVYAMGTGGPIRTLLNQLDELVDAVSQSDKLVTVDCTTDTIGDALANAPPGGLYIVTVEGTCVEEVAITRDDVILQGIGGGVDGRITIDGAQRVVIDGLTVSGVGVGIEAVRNAAITVQNSIIEHNDFTGIAVRQGSFALIEGNTIRLNGECEILATDSGNVRMINNTIVSNQPDSGTCGAIGAYRNSMIRMTGGNTVTQDALSGLAVDVEHGSTFRQDGGHDTIMGNVQILNMSNADFRNVDINGDIDLLQISVLRMRNPRSDPENVTVTGNININLPNLARFSNPTAVINGNLNCNGGQLFGEPMVIPPGSINCFAAPPPPPPGPLPPEPPPMP